MDYYFFLGEYFSNLIKTTTNFSTSSQRNYLFTTKRTDSAL